jgi:hypothetical protein
LLALHFPAFRLQPFQTLADKLPRPGQLRRYGNHLQRYKSSLFSVSRRRKSLYAVMTAPFALTGIAVAQTRHFILQNSCAETVWVAGAGTTTPAFNGSSDGSELPVGAMVTTSVATPWVGGRFWGRRQCTFDANGKGSCLIGDCGNGPQCTHAGAGNTSLAMVRASTADDAAFAGVIATPGHGVAMMIRTATGVGVMDLAKAAENVPVWVRLQHLGNTLRALPRPTASTGRRSLQRMSV